MPIKITIRINDDCFLIFDFSIFWWCKIFIPFKDDIITAGGITLCIGTYQIGIDSISKTALVCIRNLSDRQIAVDSQLVTIALALIEQPVREDERHSCKNSKIENRKFVKNLKKLNNYWKVPKFRNLNFAIYN